METSGSPRSYPNLSSGERDRASNLFASAQRCSRGEVKDQLHALTCWLRGCRFREETDSSKRLRDSNLPTDVAKMALSLIAIPSTSFNGMFNVRAC